MTLAIGPGEQAPPVKHVVVTKPPRPEFRLSSVDYSLLVQVLRVQSKTGQTETMRTWCRNRAREYGARTLRDKGNLYITKGVASVYPCYVAHLDTVHSIVPDDHYTVCVDREDGALFGWDQITNKAVGVGGDDKVGIMIALSMLRDLDVCKVALFRDEETGGHGAADATMSFFDDCAFVIEADRRGNADIVRNASSVELFGNEFDEAIRPTLREFGYSNAWGMLTDVLILKRNGLGVACFNVSCGYHLPHQDGTYVMPDEVARTLELIKRITDITKDRKWLHTYTAPPPVTYYYNNGRGNAKDARQTARQWIYDQGRQYWRVDDVDEEEETGLLTDDERKELGKLLASTTATTWSKPVAQHVRDALIDDGVCPDCGGRLEYSYWCNACGDWYGSAGTAVRDGLREWADWDEFGPKGNNDRNGIDATKECPVCHDHVVEWDAREELWWCWSCQDYVKAIDRDIVDVEVIDPRDVEVYTGP